MALEVHKDALIELLQNTYEFFIAYYNPSSESSVALKKWIDDLKYYLEDGRRTPPIVLKHLELGARTCRELIALEKNQRLDVLTYSLLNVGLDVLRNKVKTL